MLSDTMERPALLSQAYRHLLLALEEMPLFLEQALAELPSEAWGRQPERDRSPLLEHVWHLHDCEVDLYGLRIHKALSEELPWLPPMEVSDWPRERAYHLRDGAVGLAAFSSARQALLAELRALEPAQLGRSGIRGDGSSINILGLLELLADHDRDHRWRIAAILREFAGLHG
ncbi:DinB family protein [Chromobacterium sp. IIBBL 290-4]|uniref:DinB family protein n=1 Tax=Chromobacterium sp. IIBBL 290-4 TaxID=2953890 RepID=UPI0020B6E439|nr:DinB family protein [Chromobacterium sp. IIBBL 290-4]UTH75951.1 DinB family protein [Chromobacterium sp. IIBBL 290-4]